MTDALRLTHVNKTFKIPTDRSSSLKHRVVHWRSASRYRILDALHDISFEIPHGSFFGVIGANGSGKSTLLKVMARIYRPTSGEVYVNGRVSPFLELGVGFNPELTARENIMINGAILGLSRKELLKRTDQILDFAELREFADQKLKNYSSGMHVRLAFSISIQTDAEILLMDEVLAVGDASFQEKCFDVFSQYRRDGKTVVLVTHDLGSVEKYCDRAILLDHGNKVADGAASDVTTQYRRLVASGGHEVQPGESPDRWGTKEVVIDQVRLVDTAGKLVETVGAGQPLRIEVDYGVAKPVGDFVCGLTFYREDGHLLAATDTHMEGTTLPATEAGQKGRVIYVLDSLVLLAGAYRFTVELRDHHSPHAYDHMDQSFELRVTDPLGRVGNVNLGGRWQLAGVRSGAASASR